MATSGESRIGLAEFNRRDFKRRLRLDCPQQDEQRESLHERNYIN